MTEFILDIVYVTNELEYNLGKILQQVSDDIWYREQLNTAGIILV